MAASLLRSLAAVALAVSVFGCATPEMRHVAVETTEPLSFGTLGARAISVRCTATDTVLEIGDAIFTIRGHRGYLGQLGVDEGWLSSGKVTIRWLGHSVTIQGRTAWGVSTIGDGPVNLVIDQDGKSAKSVFKAG
jgi:hypothetical protein